MMFQRFLQQAYVRFQIDCISLQFDRLTAHAPARVITDVVIERGGIDSLGDDR